MPTRRRPDWSVLPPPHPSLKATVVIPVRNEARRLPAALRALAAQQTLGGDLLPREHYEVIVLANNCTDASVEAARRCAARHRGLALHVVEVWFASAQANVGHARSCLMTEACRRLERTAGEGGVIASTDGDTRVAPDWLAMTLAGVAAGADAVGGRIVAGTDVALPPPVLAMARRDESYQRLRARLEHLVDPDQADPWPRHHQHFGASLAVTAGAYRLVGGMAAEPFLEDEAFYRRLRLNDLRVRHDPRVWVVTSSRRRGRVAVGLSWQLREWQARVQAGEDAMVESPTYGLAMMTLRRRLRRFWKAIQRRKSRGFARATERQLVTAASLTRRLRIGAPRLLRECRRLCTFGALWAFVEPRIVTHPSHGGPRLVAMREAITSLRSLIAREQRRRAAPAGRGDM